MDWGLIIPLVIVGIEFCLSIACMVMGGVHLNECQNQAAIFLLVNGGVPLLSVAIVAILVVICAYSCGEDGQVISMVLPYFLIFGAVLLKLGLSIYGSVAIFGKFETHLITI